MADASGGALEQVRQLLQRVARIDAAGWIVRRVDDDEAGLRADGRVDCLEVEVEGRQPERSTLRGTAAAASSSGS